MKDFRLECFCFLLSYFSIDGCVQDFSVCFSASRSGSFGTDLQSGPIPDTFT